MNARIESAQRGVILLEALISILIFSFGILAIIGLQAAALGDVSESKYRNEAGFYADRLIGEMWASNRANLAANFATGGGVYDLWYNNMKNADSLTGLLGLPGADVNPPTVAIVPINNPATGKTVSYDVTVTVFWQSPSKPVHQHAVFASITTD